MLAPKITHQIWMQGWENLPEKFQKNVESLHEKNPDFQHMKWDETTLRKECLKLSKECADKFDSFEILMSKVDFGRDVVLYNYGGMSVDTDMLSIKPIRDTPDLDKYDFIISSQTFPFNLFNLKNTAMIICTKGHPLMMTIINTMIQDKRTQADFMSKETYINSTTGPFFINSVVDKYQGKVKVLDYKYYEPCSPSDPYCRVSSETIMDHQHELSWMNPSFKILFSILYFILHFFVYILVGIVAIVLFFMFKSKLRKFKLSKMFR